MRHPTLTNDQKAEMIGAARMAYHTPLGDDFRADLFRQVTKHVQALAAKELQGHTVKSKSAKQP